MNVKYTEGDWFAIPLRTGGYAIGIIARATKRGPCVLAYLFGPRREAIPEFQDIAVLRADSAIKVWMMGDLSLIDGSWPILGRSIGFDRSFWPLPKFVRSEEVSNRSYIVTYSEDDPNQVISEVKVTFGTSTLERDVGHGAGAVEIHLTKMLNKQ